MEVSREERLAEYISRDFLGDGIINILHIDTGTAINTAIELLSANFAVDDDGALWFVLRDIEYGSCAPMRAFSIEQVIASTRDCDGDLGAIADALQRAADKVRA